MMSALHELERKHKRTINAFLADIVFASSCIFIKYCVYIYRFIKTVCDYKVIRNLYHKCQRMNCFLPFIG